MEGLTYAEVGATQDDPLPAGYRHLRYRSRLGRGGFDVAAEAVLTFAMHRAGEQVAASAPRAAPGVAVTTRIGLGPLRLIAPCRVVWAEDGPDRAGFGYGTLAGHPARGEESFVVTREAGDEVWFTVTAFSVPARWYMAAAGPIAPLIQAYYARHRARALRRLYRAGTLPRGSAA
jgi:uncharacterized protein (UPF0548 family)